MLKQGWLDLKGSLHCSPPKQWMISLVSAACNGILPKPYAKWCHLGIPMTQNMVLQTHANKPYGASTSSEQFIRSERDFIELLTWGTNNATDLYLLMDTNFVPAFYDLSSGLAGEILQKISNYRIRLAIFGSFEIITSRRFREFINESNKGSSVRFFQEKAQAQAWLLS